MGRGEAGGGLTCGGALSAGACTCVCGGGGVTALQPLLGRHWEESPGRRRVPGRGSPGPVGLGVAELSVVGRDGAVGSAAAVSPGAAAGEAGHSGQPGSSPRLLHGVPPGS